MDSPKTAGMRLRWVSELSEIWDFSTECSWPAAAAKTMVGAFLAALEAGDDAGVIHFDDVEVEDGIVGAAGGEEKW